MDREIKREEQTAAETPLDSKWEKPGMTMKTYKKTAHKKMLNLKMGAQDPKSKCQVHKGAKRFARISQMGNKVL